jgi:hypothetical protein
VHGLGQVDRPIGAAVNGVVSAQVAVTRALKQQWGGEQVRVPQTSVHYFSSTNLCLTLERISLTGGCRARAVG